MVEGILLEGQPAGGGLGQPADIPLGIVHGLLPEAVGLGVGVGDDLLGLGVGLVQLLLGGLLDRLLGLGPGLVDLLLGGVQLALVFRLERLAMNCFTGL